MPFLILKTRNRSLTCEGLSNTDISGNKHKHMAEISYQANKRLTVMAALSQQTKRNPTIDDLSLELGMQLVIKKINLIPLGSSCWGIRSHIASLRFRFIFLWPGNFDKLRNKKLPFNDGDGNIGEKNEPRDWVQATVKDMRHDEWKQKEEL